MLSTSTCSNQIPFWSPYHRIKLIIVRDLGHGKDVNGSSLSFGSLALGSHCSGKVKDSRRDTQGTLYELKATLN